MNGLMLLFPGQGSQTVGMGKHLWETHVTARDVFREAEDYLGWDLRGLCLQGPSEELTRTDNAQIAIFVCSVAAWRVLERRGTQFEVALGHSLGEYSALVATGHLSFQDGLHIVQERGRAMWACAQENPGAMAAVVGLDDEQVEQLCSELSDVWPANYNCPGQVVISGSIAAVEDAGRLALDRGARRVIPLPVSGAFHSPFVKEAAASLATLLETVKFAPSTRGRFFSTTDLSYPQPDQLREVMSRQMVSSVKFSQSLRALLDRHECAIEVGPGGVLAGLVKRVSPRFPVLGTEDGASLEDTLKRLQTC